MISETPTVMGHPPGLKQRPVAKDMPMPAGPVSNSNGRPKDATNGVYTGKEHNWALSTSSRLNKDGIWQHVFTFGLIFFTAWFNSLPWTAALYDRLTSRYGTYAINLWGTFIVSSAVYWALGLIFMALDMNPTLHSYVRKWKIQPDRTITWAEYRQVMLCVVKNQLFVNLPMCWLVATYWPLDTSGNLPGLWETIKVYFSCMICEEAGFYFVHRAVHHPLMYKRVHKMHHQFTAPVAFASTYCTLFEQTFSNLGPVVLGIVLLRPHWSLMILFFNSLEIGTLCTHSDYNIPGLYDALTHDWHHYAFTENFGPTGLLDEILGTNKQFKVWLGELQRRDKDAAGWQGRARTTLAEATPIDS